MDQLVELQVFHLDIVVVLVGGLDDGDVRIVALVFVPSRLVRSQRQGPSEFVEAAADPVAGLFPGLSQFDTFGVVASAAEQLAELGTGDFQRFSTQCGSQSEDDQELEPAKCDRRLQPRTTCRSTGRRDAQECGGQSDQGSSAQQVDQPEPGQECADDRTQGPPGVDAADSDSGFRASRQSHCGNDRRHRPHRRGRRAVDRRHLHQHPHRPTDIRGRAGFENPLRQPDDRTQERRRNSSQPVGGNLVQPHNHETMETGQQQQPTQGATMVKPVGQHAADVVADRDPGQHHPDHAGPGIQRLADVVSQQAGGRQFQHHDRQAGDKHDGVTADQEPPGTRLVPRCSRTRGRQLRRVQLVPSSRQPNRSNRSAGRPTPCQQANGQQRHRHQSHRQQRQRRTADDHPRTVIVDQVKTSQERADDRTKRRPRVDIADGEARAAATRQRQAGDNRRNRAQYNGRQQEDRRHDAQDPNRPFDRLGPGHSNHPTVQHQRQAAGQCGQREQDGQELQMAETVGQHPAGVTADSDPGQDDSDHTGPGVKRLADVVSQ